MFFSQQQKKTQLKIHLNESNFSHNTFPIFLITQFLLLFSSVFFSLSSVSCLNRIRISLVYQNRWTIWSIKGTYDGSTHPILSIVRFTIYAYLNWNLWVTSILFDHFINLNVNVKKIVRVNNEHSDDHGDISNNNIDDDDDLPMPI